MRNKLAIFLGVVIVLSLATNVWSQNPITADSPFQIRYASNLDVGESWVNITNSGVRGAAINSGTGASTTGAICANVYVFSPDEQMISCCSCPVTPNGLKSLGVRQDLISNTLTPAVPTSVVIKLVGSTPVGGSCNNSAASPGALTAGLLAWGTTAHAGVTSETVTPNTTKKCLNNNCNGSNAGSAWCQQNCPPIVTTATGFSTTETPFLPATLSAGELLKLTELCTFIVANGSGFGICRSCQLGGE